MKINSRAAIYARVSTGRQEAEQTVLSQLAELRTRLKEDGLTGVQEFVDEGYGRDTLERPALDRLRDLVVEGRLDRIYAQAPDRLASGGRLILLVEEFQNAGIDLMFLTGETEATPEGRLLLSMQGAFSEYEKAKIGERTRRGKTYWSKEGFLVSGVNPYGYRFVHRVDRARATLEPDPFQSLIVQEMYRMLVNETMSTRAIADTLNKRQVPTARGAAQWRPTTVARMLQNRVYAGTVVYQKTRRKDVTVGRERYKKRRTSAPRPLEEQISIPVPPLIDEATWKAAQRQLKLNSKNSRRNNRVNRYLLRGFVRCPRCGGSYTGASNHDRRTYRCVNHDPVVSSKRCTPGSVPAAALEEAVWAAVEDALKRPGLLKSQYRSIFLAEDGTDDQSGLKRSIAKQLSALVRRENRLVEAYSAEALTLEQLKDAMIKLRAERAELQRELATEEDRQARKESLDASMQGIEEFCSKVAAGLENLDFDGKRKLLDLLVERIDLAEGDEVMVHVLIPRESPSGGSGELEELRLCHPEPVEG